MRRHSGIDWIELVIGIVLMAMGLLTLARPELAVTGVVYALGIAAVIMGVADIILFVRVEQFAGFGPVLSLITGIMSVMSGIMMIAYPETGALTLTMLLPIWFIAHCISRLLNLWRVRFTAGVAAYRIMLVLNIIGLILGCMMLASPLFTMSVLRGFASIYMIVLGADAVIIAVS